jgi:hypothetical protein
MISVGIVGAFPSGTAKLHAYFGIPFRTEWIEELIEARLGQDSDLRQMFSYSCGRSRSASAAAPLELLRFGMAEDVVRFS